MTQVEKIKKLSEVLGKYFTDVKVGYDFWEDGFCGVEVSHNKSKVEISPDKDTDKISIMFTENGRVYPCDEIVPTKEYEFFGEFIFKGLVA